MLQLTGETLSVDPRIRPDTLAFCQETGANFIESRRADCYALIIRIGDTEIIHKWPREGTTSEQALARAQQELGANTALAATLPQRQRKPLPTVTKINNAIRRNEVVYLEADDHVLYKILFSRHHQSQFRVKLALDRRWHSADINSVVGVK